MPIVIFLATFTDPNFNETKGLVLIITLVAIFSGTILVISLLSRKIIRRFSVDHSTRSLIYEVFWGGIRVVKRSFPFDTINKFDLVNRNVPKGRYSSQQIEVLVILFQSGKMKYLTSVLDQDHIFMWGNQLNNLLQNEGGFPAERFYKRLDPYWPPQSKKTKKILIGLIIFFSVVLFALLGFMIILL
jgi:hypothetical protein